VGRTASARHLKCLAGSMVKDKSTSKVMYDDTKVESCKRDETLCIKLKMHVKYPDFEAIDEVGTCLNPLFQSYMQESVNNARANEEMLPRDSVILSASYHVCKKSLCFDFRVPVSSSRRQKLQCYFGSRFVDKKTNKVLFEHRRKRKCKSQHNVCGTGVTSFNVNTGGYLKTVTSFFYGCFDHLSMKPYAYDLLVPYVPTTNNEKANINECAKIKCAYYPDENPPGHCICPRTVLMEMLDPSPAPIQLSSCRRSLCNG